MGRTPAKIHEEARYFDIMKPRRLENNIFTFMSRRWIPQKSLMMDKYYTPQELKDIAAKSVYIDAVIESESTRTGAKKEELRQEVLKILEEMGLDRKLYAVRWMGIFFMKMSFMMKIGVFVNETTIFQLKSTMGRTPVLFLPTHRSYADFCLMTYLCYHYDIELPAVAAGMDFYSMAIVGRSMRDTCAFYIRRSLAGDNLYAAVLRQYVRTLVAHHAAPIEFFLEGTRSRSNKSLAPKYGMLSMALMPLFAGEVSDVTVVPVNISYDRLIEHSLFAYEHLGVSKPKESTGTLLKSLRSLNDNFGNVYINCGTPMSIKEYAQGALNVSSNERLKPSDLQQITPQQFAQVQDIANQVVYLQQQCTVVTITNLLALVLMQCLIKNEVLALEDVLKELGWMIDVLQRLGASVFENDIPSSVQRILVVHNKMMKLDKVMRLKLISSLPMNISNGIKKKMKGHTLEAETMVNAIPIIQLQLYVNPVLHYLVPPAVVTLLVHRGAISRELLTTEYHLIRKLLRHEFFYLEKIEENTLAAAIQYCLDNDVMTSQDERFVLGRTEKLQYLLRWAVWPALTTILMCADIMREQKTCEHKQALKLIQQRAEASQCHPYCLSLEAIANCLQGLVLAEALVRWKIKDITTYEVNPAVMDECCQLVRSVLPAISVDFGKSNSVILDQRFPSRL